MGRGKRYDSEPKLNIKKVFAVILAIAVIVMFVIGIKTLLSKDRYRAIKNRLFYNI